MKKTKKIIITILCIVAMLTSLTLVSFADVVDKGSYTFDTNTGEVTAKFQSVEMERYPLPIEDGSIVHNGYFTTIGTTPNFQLDVTLISPVNEKTITMSFPYPDVTKMYEVSFGGGVYTVRLSPSLQNEDGSIYYLLQTISYTVEGNFGYFYNDFTALVVERPTPQASQSITDYVVRQKNQEINNLNFNLNIERENLRYYQNELEKSNEALEQGNWFMSFFDGMANAVLKFVTTIGSFQVGGISLISVISTAIIVIVLFIIIKVVRA